MGSEQMTRTTDGYPDVPRGDRKSKAPEKQRHPSPTVLGTGLAGTSLEASKTFGCPGFRLRQRTSVSPGGICANAASGAGWLRRGWARQVSPWSPFPVPSTAAAHRWDRASPVSGECPSRPRSGSPAASELPCQSSGGSGEGCTPTATPAGAAVRLGRGHSPAELGRQAQAPHTGAH